MAMGFLRNIRSRSKLKHTKAEAQVYGSQAPQQQYHNNGRPMPQLPDRVLKLLFSYVCPHIEDETYSTSEDSMIGDGCCLCEMRDLSCCASVNRSWAGIAQALLYHSIRLDPVHYCEREITLSAKRKRTSRFDRNGEPADPTKQRMELLARTVRDVEYLAVLVEILKVPYMTREACKADLARIVSFLPNLRYVDLPEALYRDDPSSAVLKNELLKKCPDIRTMKYYKGAEESFTMLAHYRQWQSLEILELKGLGIEADTLLYVLASLPALHELKLGKMSCLEDAVFKTNNQLPPFPPLHSLFLDDCPSVTSAGLVAYLSRPETREVLETLRLSQTGVLPQTLHEVLATAPHLKELTINETVARSLPLSPIPPLASRSLQTLRFEILPATPSLNPPSETYYNYLASSLLSGTLPSLTALYAFSPSLPDLLLFQPAAPFAGGAATSRFSVASSIYSVAEPTHGLRLPPAPPEYSHPAGIVSPLKLYTKPAEATELEWYLTEIEPPSDRNGRRGSATATRPLSLIKEGNRDRDSVLVGNGFGGFLAVPNADGGGSPRLSHSRKGSAAKGNEWMG